jgi:hypothetical protein
LNQLADATDILNRSLKGWQALVDEIPASPMFVVRLIEVQMRLGEAAIAAKDPRAALDYLHSAEKLRIANPEMINRDPAGPVVNAVLCKWLARAEIDRGHYREGAERAETLAAIAHVDGDVNAFNSACYLARAAELASQDIAKLGDERNRLAEAYAKRAVEHLKLANERGFVNTEAFTTDSDLRSLRHRADFEQLLSRLKSKQL